MGKDSCPATRESPVQPYLGKCGLPKGCSPAPEQSRDMQGQQGDVSFGLGAVAFYGRSGLGEEDAGMSWGSSSPPWVLAARQQYEV